MTEIVKATKQTITLEDETELHYLPVITFRCCYCGKLATIVRFIDQAPSIGLIHETPECAEFSMYDPLIFIQNNREWMEADNASKNNN